MVGKKVVGANGFEPSTSWSRTRRASQAALRPDRHAQADAYAQPKPDSQINIAATSAVGLPYALL